VLSKGIWGGLGDFLCSTDNVLQLEEAFLLGVRCISMVSAFANLSLLSENQILETTEQKGKKRISPCALMILVNCHAWPSSHTQQRVKV